MYPPIHFQYFNGISSKTRHTFHHHKIDRTALTVSDKPRKARPSRVFFPRCYINVNILQRVLPSITISRQTRNLRCKARQLSFSCCTYTGIDSDTYLFGFFPRRDDFNFRFFHLSSFNQSSIRFFTGIELNSLYFLAYSIFIMITSKLLNTLSFFICSTFVRVQATFCI